VGKAPFSNAPKEYDVYAFESSELEAVTKGVKELLAALKKSGKYTDLRKFTLRCECGVGIIGQQGAVEHTRFTGHSNYSEYS
jgi:hypothetical protein